MTVILTLYSRNVVHVFGFRSRFSRRSRKSGYTEAPGVQKELAMYIGVGAILLVLLIVVLFGTMRRRA
jgi:hypothetical protein